MKERAVMISIRPKWCMGIFSGRKNLEFRKTMPKIDLPFKCYVYCTQKRQRLLDIIKDGDNVYGAPYHGKIVFIKTDETGLDTEAWIMGYVGKVIGEMTVDRMEEITVGYKEGVPFAMYGGVPFCDFPEGDLQSGGITLGEYLKYKGEGKVYGWHIADYKLFYEPKEISDFRYAWSIDRLKAAPQSYVFVNELRTDE